MGVSSEEPVPDGPAGLLPNLELGSSPGRFMCGRKHEFRGGIEIPSSSASGRTLGPRTCSLGTSVISSVRPLN